MLYGQNNRICSTKRHSAGFTLIELLVAAGIAVLIFSIGFSLLHGIRLAQSDSQARIRASESAQQFFRLIERDIMMAFPGPFDEMNEKEELRFQPPLKTPDTDPTTFTDELGFIGDGIQMTTVNVDYSDSAIVDFINTYSAARGEVLDLNVGLSLSTVRYYVIMDRVENANDVTDLEEDVGFLYREVSLVQAPPSPVFPTDDPPYDFGYALFGGVNKLELDFFRWNPVEREMEEITVATDIPLATHVNVRIGFLDSNKKFSLAKRKRNFYKLIPIPTAFKN